MPLLCFTLAQDLCVDSSCLANVFGGVGEQLTIGSTTWSLELLSFCFASLRDHAAILSDAGHTRARNNHVAAVGLDWMCVS
jgi:hypothetical protein